LRFHETFILAIAFDAAQKIDSQQHRIEIEELKKHLQAEAKEAVDTIRKNVSAVMEFTQNAAVSKYAGMFETRAAESGKEANKWLAAFGVLFVLLVGYGVYLLFHEIKVDSTAQGIAQAAGKVIIFSTLITGLLWSGKIYKALRHIQEVNRHRELALRTFEAFVESTGKSEDVKNAVLLQTTQCIFSAQQTGYLGKDEDSPTGPTQIIEVLKGMTSKSDA